MTYTLCALTALLQPCLLKVLFPYVDVYSLYSKSIVREKGLTVITYNHVAMIGVQACDHSVYMDH